MLYGILHRGEGGLDMATQEERLQKLEYDFTRFKADAVQSLTSLDGKFDSMLQMLTALTKKIAE